MTPYTDIYARAVFRFADYKFLQQYHEEREEVLEKYLHSARVDFQRMCSIDLTDYDSVNKCFNQTLGDEEIEILALGISFYWLSFKTLNSELLKNALNSKDYYFYSPANLLKEVQTLRKTLRKEFYGKMRQYSFDHGDLSTVQN